MRSLFEFFNYEQFMKDVATITDTARGKKLTMAQLAMAIMRNYDAATAPEGFPISQIVNLFKPSSTTSNSRSQRPNEGREKDDDVWRVLCVEGMWFQDLSITIFAAPRCASFRMARRKARSPSAYNTGVGWRQIIEEMHKTACLSEWYKDHGRHAVYAKGNEVPNIAKTRSLSLPVIAKILENDMETPDATPYLVEDKETVVV